MTGRRVGGVTRSVAKRAARVLADLLDQRARAHGAESDCHALLGRLERALLHAHAGDECRRIESALRANRDLTRVAILGRPRGTGT